MIVKEEETFLYLSMFCFGWSNNYIRQIQKIKTTKFNYIYIHGNPTYKRGLGGES